MITPVFAGTFDDDGHVFTMGGKRVLAYAYRDSMAGNANLLMNLAPVQTVACRRTRC